MEIVTPDQIINALSALRIEGEKGIEAQYQAERDLAIKQLAAEQIEAAAFLRMKGLVGERQAIAKLESHEARQEAELAKAVFNRVRTKMQQLQQQQSALQTQARLVEITYRS